MTLQYSVTVRNAKLDAVETAAGTAPLLKVYTGSPPATCAAATTGTLLASITCPSDWMAAASGGTKALSGTWSDLSVDTTGTAGYFRVFDSTGTTCHIQGTVTAAGGGGDMIVNTVSLVAAGTFTVTAFTLTAGNA